MGKVRFISYKVFAWLLCMLVSACDVSSGQAYDVAQLADSLCGDIVNSRYKNTILQRAAAERLLSLPGVGDEECMIAKNALAYSAFMAMDYARAAKLYREVLDEAQCEVERLVADVGLMTLYYRISANRDFFDARSSALNRVRRIREEEETLPNDERERFLAARIELSAVSLCYFANLGMTEEALQAADYLVRNIEDVTSPALRIYGRIIENYIARRESRERVETLTNLYARAVNSGQSWLTANCRLMLAVLLRDDSLRSAMLREQPSRLSLLGVNELSADTLPLKLALDAASDFENSGDRYMMIEALAVAASCETQRGGFENALSLLDEAMDSINSYYSRYYPHAGKAPFSIYEPDDSVAVLRAESDSVANIFECLLSVRREAGCAFAGVGDKYSSDINRNSYLDLLRTTRLNKQIESRIQMAEDNASRLYIWFILLLVLLVLFVLSAYILNVRWNRRNVQYTRALDRILGVCRVLMTALPQEPAGRDDVNAAVVGILNSSLGGLWGIINFVIAALDEVLRCDDGFMYTLPLKMHDDKADYMLVIMSECRLAKENISMLQILLPYIDAAVAEGMRMAGAGDRIVELQEQVSSGQFYLAGHKRENILKRVSLSVVNGMRPYMNRMLNELNHLADTRQQTEEGQRRLEYLAELTAVLDEYNASLEKLIKMRSGELSLNIENFAVSDILGIVAKGARSFELKGLELRVGECDAVVKADRALTLFMVNTLTENAAKFTPHGGRVVVEAAAEENYVEFSVTDTGVGLSQQDIGHILNEKVYDASLIGKESGSALKKGYGFGLMNCKGIIEKYRKTDSLFSVCRMDIASEPGRGSRFSFRLPKGVMRRLFVLLLFMLPFAAAASRCNDYLYATHSLADSVYVSNVEGRYSDALLHAQSALDKLNAYYRGVIGGQDTLSLASGKMSEMTWWRNAMFPDSLTEDIFYNLLDIRNETAVAALALHKWSLYRYNNAIYTQLYRLVHEDKELVQHYERMQAVVNYRQAAIVLCVTLLLLLLAVYIVMYMRNVVMHKMNIGHLLRINAQLLRAADDGTADVGRLAQNMAIEIFGGLHELMRMEHLALLLKHESSAVVATMPEKLSSQPDVLLQNVADNVAAYVSDKLLVIPLMAGVAGEDINVGALRIDSRRTLIDSDIVMIESVARYAASMAYHSMEYWVGKSQDIDSLHDEIERLKLEESNIHVHNMVMDNCLSMIKHETIYYPGRIRAMVQKLRNSDCNPDEWQDSVAAIRELMDYYISVFEILSACAMHRLDNMSFSPSVIPMNELFARMQAFVARKASKNGCDIALSFEPTDALVHGDSILVEFMMENIFEALLAVNRDGRLHMRCTREAAVLRVEIVDDRRRLSSDEIGAMFVPVGDSPSRMNYLAAKEIVRMHEDCMNWRGGRIEAFNCEEGAVLLFTLPAAVK